MKFNILSAAVRAAEATEAAKRTNEVTTCVRKLLNVWGDTPETRQRAWNIATWRMRRGLSLNIKRVLP